MCALAIAATATTAARAQEGYTFRGIAQSIAEVDFLVPISDHRYAFQNDFQVTTQSEYLDEDANPYSWVQRIHARPWIHFHPNDHTQWSFSTSYLKRPAIPPQDIAERDEVRVTTMGQVTQPRSFGSIFEQFRAEVRNLRDTAGVWTHVPRLRARFGQNYDIGKSGRKPRLNVYQEVMFKYQAHRKALDIVRGFVAYGFNPRPGVALSLGFLTQAQLKSSGRDFDLYFGPSVSLRRTFGKTKRPAPPPDPDPD